MSEINEYDIGTEVEMEALFTKDGEPANPTTTTLMVKTPAGDEVPVAPVNPEAGRFVGAYTVEDNGDFYYRFVGTGNVKAAKEGRFRVRRSNFA